ncbi:hypothetical protein GW17_00037319, partial [Ensete ventricosum]
MIERRCNGGNNEVQREGHGWKWLRQRGQQRQGRRQRRREEHLVGEEQQRSGATVGASKGGSRQQWRKRAMVKKANWKRLQQRVA